MIEIERQELAGIPCVTLRDAGVAESPVIIHYHGWTGNKGAVETPDQSQARLASVGFLVVAPDCYEHGERATDAWFRAQFNGWAFICQAMDKTRQEAADLFDAVMALPFASARDPQVTGGSMGGLIAQMVFAENSEFVSLVSVVGRSSFYQADEWCRRAQAGSWCDDWCAEYATQTHPRALHRPPRLICRWRAGYRLSPGRQCGNRSLNQCARRERGTFCRSRLWPRLFPTHARKFRRLAGRARASAALQHWTNHVGAT